MFHPLCLLYDLPYSKSVNLNNTGYGPPLEVFPRCPSGPVDLSCLVSCRVLFQFNFSVRTIYKIRNKDLSPFGGFPKFVHTIFLLSQKFFCKPKTLTVKSSVKKFQENVVIRKEEFTSTKDRGHLWYQ